jgi:hypothetical protein
LRNNTIFKNEKKKTNDVMNVPIFDYHLERWPISIVSVFYLSFVGIKKYQIWYVSEVNTIVE